MMTSFGALFRQLFKQKAKSAYLLVIIQLIASLVLTVLVFWNDSKEMSHAQIGSVPVQNSIQVFVLSLILLFTGLGILITLVYFVMTSWKNEKINRSQTWRLIPVSSEKLCVANTLSSFVALIWLNIMQLVITVIGGGIIYVSSNDVRKGVSSLLNVLGKEHFWQSNWNLFLQFIILSLLAGLAGYITISFYHFITRVVIDFLPNNTAAKLISVVVRFLMLILVIWLIVKFFDLAGQVYNAAFMFAGPGDYWIILVFMIFDIIFGGINILLIKKFVEAKGDR